MSDLLDKAGVSDLVERRSNRRRGSFVGRLVLVGALVGVGYLVWQSIPDIVRYIKIERM